MYNLSQEEIFMLFFIIGLLIGIIFDFFRAIRKNFKTTDFMTLIEDILFLSIVFALIIFSIIKINRGEVRFYPFLGIFFGILLYSLTISNLCVIIFSVIVGTCRKIIQIPYFTLKKSLMAIKKPIRKFNKH